MHHWHHFVRILRNIAIYTSNEMDVAVAVGLKMPGKKLLLALEHLVELLAQPQVRWPHPPDTTHPPTFDVYISNTKLCTQNSLCQR